MNIKKIETSLGKNAAELGYLQEVTTRLYAILGNNLTYIETIAREVIPII